VCSEFSVVARGLPALRLGDDQVADAAEQVGLGMPAADAEKTLIRRDMQVEAGRMHVLAKLVTELDADVGLVGCLVACEARVAIDAHQRTAQLARIGAELRRKIRQQRRHRADELEGRRAHAVLVFCLVLFEPGFFIVAGKLFEKPEGGGTEGHGGILRCAIDGLLYPPWGRAWSGCHRLGMINGGALMRQLKLVKAFTLMEPGPVVLVTTHDGKKANIMTISWTMVVDFTPVFAITTGEWNHSYAALRKNRECVIAIPTIDLLDKVVGIGTCSGADTDKFASFGLTPMQGKRVKAPLIKECLANIECKVIDIVKKHNIVVLEAVAAYIDTARKEKRTVHAVGDGTFIIDGRKIDRKKMMAAKLPPGV
jgi:flavin reductase (DIM6/NTAB) family NADH-FMN oxidoreductase RutF